MLIARTYPRQRDCGIFVFVGSRLQHSNPTPLHPAPVPYPNRVDWSKRLFLRQSWILALDSVDLAQSPFVLHVDTHTHTSTCLCMCVCVCVCFVINLTWLALFFDDEAQTNCAQLWKLLLLLQVASSAASTADAAAATTATAKESDKYGNY